MKPDNICSSIKTVFSLDYDGCACVFNEDDAMSGLLKMLKFEEFKKKNGIKSGEIIIAYAQEVLNKIREVLDEKLDAEISDMSEVDLYVGSLRQCHTSDLVNSSGNNNGSCFDCYSKHAVRKKWNFATLLLADVMDKCGLRDQALSLGTSFIDKSKSCYDDILKTNIIEQQLKNVLRVHGPNRRINFIFVDDDEKNVILPELKAYFSAGKGRECLASNVTLKLFKFDWFVCIDTNINDFWGDIYKKQFTDAMVSLKSGLEECFCEKHSLSLVGDFVHDSFVHDSVEEDRSLVAAAVPPSAPPSALAYQGQAQAQAQAQQAQAQDIMGGLFGGAVNTNPGKD